MFFLSNLDSYYISRWLLLQAVQINENIKYSATLMFSSDSEIYGRLLNDFWCLSHSENAILKPMLVNKDLQTSLLIGCRQNHQPIISHVRKPLVTNPWIKDAYFSKY